MTADTLLRLRQVLDALEAPRVFWWRDDDAGPDDPATGAFLKTVMDWQIPVALAVIPAHLTPEVTGWIKACPYAAIVQHGFAHENHGAPGQKKIELGGGIDRGLLAEQMAAGRKRLEDAFGPQFGRMMVPPWNRIDADVVELAAAQLPALSTSGRRDARLDNGLYRLNTHLDFIDWQGTGVQKPIGPVLDELTALLIDPGFHDEPLGLLSHHRVQSQSDLDALNPVFNLLAQHEKIRFAHLSDLIRFRT